MASGPPPSAAESSKIAEEAPDVNHPPESRDTNITALTKPHQNPYASLTNAQQPYQAYWQNAWPMNTLYPGGASAVPPATHYSQPTYAPYQTHYYTMSPVNTTAAATAATATATAPITSASTSSSNSHTASAAISVPQATPTFVKMEIDDRQNMSSTSPSPPPPPLSSYEHWDEAIRVFLKDAGLVQALKGFECDMIMMNAQWEKTKIPIALRKLINGLDTTREYQSPKGKGRELDEDDAVKALQNSTESEVDQSLEERKLDYVHLSSGEKARTPSSINKEISAFLARNRARNDASNRSEFLLSLSEKRKRLQESGDLPEDGVVASCARTDARSIDRDVQMKYDIAKNDEGPLSRTKARKKDIEQSVKEGASSARTEGPIAIPRDEEALPRHHPGVDDRLSNIETHLAVRYVPSPPRTLWSRLKFIEDHIIRLEKDYPPWAALHFNQPNRGWPPPPRSTPIIVPPHLRSSDVDMQKPNAPGSQASQQGSSSAPSVTLPGGSKSRNTKSSLQRAVMERLEVKQAMGENADFGG
ncbi:hypothetical protein D9756_007714 [Leucocoprinus leucothites]|uniref:Uncharacterized protein n=1 Tax=Leucocoprinus leucothites TaxID=201217 RepID=A0A8H5D0Z2_9AGAR|nr:hypothetical protein D9756_007714 [Leucoagaricus leucothites]